MKQSIQDRLFYTIILGVAAISYGTGTYISHTRTNEILTLYESVGLQYHDVNNNKILDPKEKEEFNHSLYEGKDVFVDEFKTAFHTYEWPHNNDWKKGIIVNSDTMKQWLNDYKVK